jgi:hypothetical protein
MNKEIFYHLNSHRLFLYLFILAFVGQLIFANFSQKYRQNLEIIPKAPSKIAVKILSFGDSEFLFRILATRLQNSGDVFAGFASLKQYNYQEIYNWMKLLDELNNKSNLTPWLASYYYSQTPNFEDTRHIVKYLDEHSSLDINKNWWWLFQATFIAKDILKDLDLALNLAQKLAKNTNPQAPFWTRQMPAFILEKQGEGCLAFQVIQDLISQVESGEITIAPYEMAFMRHFIKERLQKLENQKFNPKKC